MERAIDDNCFSQTFQEQHQISKFIRSSNLFKIVETETHNFVKIYQSAKRAEDAFNAIIIKLPLVYADFFKDSLDLLHFIIEEPVQFANAIKYCVFSMVRDVVKSSGIDNVKSVDIDQVHVFIHFTGLPLQRDLLFQPNKNSYRTGLSEVIGILSAVAEPEKVVIQSVWYCSTGCEINKIKTSSLDVPICPNCKIPMHEYPKLRHIQNFRLIRILPADSIESPYKLNKLFRGINVRASEHVFESRFRSMEYKSHLESLRDISETQLEALLRYDSPPETPIQPDAERVNNLNEEESTKIKYDNNIYSFDNNYTHNNGQHLSQMNSQIDFSIFRNGFSNDHLSPSNERTNEYDDWIMETAHVSLNSIEILDTSICEKEKNCNEENSILEFSSDFKKSDSVEFSNMYEVEKFEAGFEEIDNIYKNLDFNFISNIQKCLTKHNVNEVSNRRCLTQIDVETLKSNPKGNVILSCPAFERNTNYLTCTSKTDILQELFPENTPAEVIDCSDLNETETSKNGVDEILKNLDFDNISYFRDYSNKQDQNQFDFNEQHLIDEYGIHDDNLNNYKKTETPNGYSIPFSIRQLYDIVKTKYSDFAFIYALSSQLCQDRVPMECFVTLKMGLLLSLVSIGNNINRTPIPIVAISNDTYMTDYLMRNVGQLGLRFLGPVDDVKTIYFNNWIQADSVLTARSGVYYAGDWTRLKLKRTETIFKTIECSTVALEKSTLNFSLETAIWTHWRSFKYSVKDQQMFNKFLKIFGIPIFVSDDNHEVLVDYTLEQTSIRIFESTVDHLSINEDDMRNFLTYVSQTNVDLSVEAALLLKNYFVASRSNRIDCLSKQSYIMLKQFAESFAKLSMHNEVLSDDVIAAIILCEHFIVNTFNSSDDSLPHFGNFTFVGAVDEYFINFKKWLNTYLEKYIKL